MKSFKDYLTESKKVYSFKVKVAGDVPEKFANDLKSRLQDKEVVTFESMQKLPVRKLPLDFPQLTDMDVHVFDVVTEYPATPEEIKKHIEEMACCEHFIVKYSADPSEEDQINMFSDVKQGSRLEDANYGDSVKVKYKDYFGDDFNAMFLKDLQKTSKQHAKDQKTRDKAFEKVGHSKTDKAGNASPVGSK